MSDNLEEKTKTRDRRKAITNNNNNNNDDQIPLSLDISKIIQKRIFGKDVTFYSIDIKSGSLFWTVEKRFSDFLSFHNELSQSYDLNKYNIKLPTASWWNKHQTIEIEERRRLLYDYLIKITNNKILSNCKIVLIFFGVLKEYEINPLDNNTGVRRSYIETVIKHVNSGDLILFHSDGLLPSLSRRIFNSNIDHVAVVVLKYHENKYGQLKRRPYLLESTSEGCYYYPLYNRLYMWHLSKAEIMIRQLNMIRNDQLDHRVEQFCDKVCGKDYSISLSRLLRKNSEYDSDHIKESYFCSELVAAFYKMLNILPNDTACSRYFPSYFAEGELNLINNASLSDAILIEFSKPEVLYAKEDQSVQIPKEIFSSKCLDQDSLKNSIFKE